MSPFDNRDFKIASFGGPESLPVTYENEAIHKMPRWWQKKIGACVGHALAKSAREYWYRKTGKIINFSPRFLYAVAKCKDGIEDEGTYPRLVASILKDYGCATEATCPNNTDLKHEEYVYNRKIENIPKEAFDEALQYRVGGYAFITIYEYSIKKAILNYGIVSALLSLGSEWWTPSWNKKDIYPLRPPKSIVSGHEICFTGWDENITVDNHWSEFWADLGFNKLNWSNYSKYIYEAIVLTDGIVIPKPTYIFTQDMHYGETSDAVKELQKRLEMPIAQQTGYFGPLTRLALIKFQTENQISLTWIQRYIPAYSVAGPKTRELLNKK